MTRSHPVLRLMTQHPPSILLTVTFSQCPGWQLDQVLLVWFELAVKP